MESKAIGDDPRLACLCPWCGSVANKTKVIDTRSERASGIIRRRRRCDCGVSMSRRFTTFEVGVEQLDALLLAADRVHDLFDLLTPQERSAVRSLVRDLTAGRTAPPPG